MYFRWAGLSKEGKIRLRERDISEPAQHTPQQQTKGKDHLSGLFCREHACASQCPWTHPAILPPVLEAGTEPSQGVGAAEGAAGAGEEGRYENRMGTTGNSRGPPDHNTTQAPSSCKYQLPEKQARTWNSRVCFVLFCFPLHAV